MRATRQDDAASAPKIPPSGSPSSDPSAATADRDCRQRLRRWLGRLTEIGHALVEHMSYIAAARQRDGRPPDGGVDLTMGFALVVRANRWIRALRARLATEPLAAKAASASDAPGSADDGPVHADWWDPPYRRPSVPPALDDCIAGLPTEQVVRQICADLKTAAGLLGYEAAGREARKIAAKIRTLLDDKAEPWMGLLPSPLIQVYRDLAAAKRNNPASPSAIARDPEPGPDSG